MTRAGIWPLVGLFAVVVSLSVAGCSTKPEQSSTGIATTGGLSPEGNDPMERLEEQRLADAVRGLSFQGTRVQVTLKSSPDRNKAVLLAKKAEETHTIKNSWFLSVGAFRDVALADPTYAPAYEGMARGFLLEQMTDHAEAALRTAVSLDKGYDKAMFELGLVRQMKGDFAGSVTEWKALVAHNPDYPEVWGRMAIASYYQHEYKAAFQYLGEADKRKQAVPPQFRDLLKEAAQQP